MAILALMGLITVDGEFVLAESSERYFQPHSWERADPQEFMKKLNVDVKTEEQLAQKKPEHILAQQEMTEMSARELAEQLKGTIKDTFVFLDIPLENRQSLVSADDFDKFDYTVVQLNSRKSKEAAENEELKRDKVAQIAMMEVQLTDKINSLIQQPSNDEDLLEMNDETDSI